MKHVVIGMVMANILVFFGYFSYASQDTPVGHDFSLSLQLVDSHIRQGDTPKFRLTLTNISNNTSQILNIDRRVDLQHTYYKLVVTKDAHPVDVPVIISDPGPITASDWIKVPSGGTRTFLLSNFPDRYQELQPGIYKAYVRFWRDPSKSHVTAYQSPLVEFVVTK